MPTRWHSRQSVYGLMIGVTACLAGCLGPHRAPEAPQPWARHTIDDTLRGADGVRLADVTSNGWLDIATPWEEGGGVRVYLHPGPEAVHKPWPAVTVGAVGSPEDAVFVDLDVDGAADVVSCSEGAVRTVWIHWAPQRPVDYRDPAAWQTQALPAVEGTHQWMFSLPLPITGRYGPDLVVGSKGRGARLGWLEAPADARDLAAWRYHPLAEVGWIMSLRAADMDGDGLRDVVVTDRRGPDRGCYWLANPGPGSALREPWLCHQIGGGNHEVMFATLADLEGDGLVDVVAATAGKELLYFQRLSGDGRRWKEWPIPIPPSAGTGKSVAVGDVNLDGRSDIVFSCEHADEGRSGVMWLSGCGQPTGGCWSAHDISGPAGVKFDLVECYDVDGDGDLDVVTCEERAGLGVIWYENPTIP